MTLIGHIVGTKGNTGRGIASIVENADYTITINLTDGTSYTTAPIAGFTDVAFDENYDLVVTKTDGTTETVETDLGSYEDLLKGYKDDAETAATNAGNSETAASGYASNALSSENNASTYAGNASGSATAASGSADSASASASSASTQALKSEGFALGEQNGSAVTSGSPYYHNNSKYFSQLSSASSTNASTSATNANTDALKSEGYAVGKQNGTSVSSDSPYYHHNAMYYNSQATNMASLATNKANSAGTDALKAEGFSVGEQNGTPVTSDSDYYENNAKYYAEQAETSAQSLVIEDALDEDSTNALENGVITKEFARKANIDGYYDTLGAGTAEQLTSNIYEEDSEPYNFRTSGGSIDIGDRENDMLVGGSVAWNQLVLDANKDYSNGESTDTRTGFYLAIQTIASPITSLVVDIVSTAKKYTKVFKTGTSALTSGIRIKHNGSVRDLNVYQNSNLSFYPSHVYFYSADFVGVDVSTADGTSIKNNQLFDLTAMFGTTIADYIYSLEQANAGAGVAFFRKYFPKPYYPYDAGTIKSVEGVSAHNTVGFNAWDEEWELGWIHTDGSDRHASDIIRSKNYIPVIPNTKYYFNVPDSTDIIYFDSDKTAIGNTDKNNQGDTSVTSRIRTTHDDCHYIRFWTRNQTTYNHDICINLSWDGERDGEYEPYVEHSYPLDDSLTLRGIPKIANGKLYYDGDTYESDGTVTRKYGIVDLGSLSWTYDSTNHNFKASVSDSRTYNAYYQVINMVCQKYEVGTVNSQPQADKQLVINKDNTNIKIWDSAYTDATAFKTAMSGAYLVYELATPTTETADPYTNPQIVDDFGTEEYVDGLYSAGTRDVAIPVGHYTQYMANLKAKLEMSPDSPNGAGDYIVRQTDGENEYVSLASNATIQDIIARLEALEGGGE